MEKKIRKYPRGFISCDICKTEDNPESQRWHSIDIKGKLGFVLCEECYEAVIEHYKEYDAD